MARGVMRWETWSARVHSYLSGQARLFMNTNAGLERARQLFKGRVSPREAYARIEVEAEQEQRKAQQQARWRQRIQGQIHRTTKG